MMPEIDGYGVLYLLNKILRPLIFRLFYYCKIRTIDMRKGMEMVLMIILQSHLGG
jgi:hypothetical protein